MRSNKLDNYLPYDCPGCNFPCALSFTKPSNIYGEFGWRASAHRDSKLKPICKLLWDSISWQITDLNLWHERAKIELEKFHSRAENAFA